MKHLIPFVLFACLLYTIFYFLVMRYYVLIKEDHSYDEITIRVHVKKGINLNSLYYHSVSITDRSKIDSVRTVLSKEAEDFITYIKNR